MDVVGVALDHLDLEQLLILVDGERDVGAHHVGDVTARLMSQPTTANIPQGLHARRTSLHIELDV